MASVKLCALLSTQEEDGQTQRPEVSEEDDTGTYNRLGKTGPAKSKTIQVMEDCGEDTTMFMFQCLMMILNYLLSRMTIVSLIMSEKTCFRYRF